MPIEADDTSEYLKYLPAIYSEEPFLGQFLRAFEQILTGDQKTQGLEQTIANVATFFSPYQERTDFLTWLAGWVALSLRADWNELQKQQFLANVVPYYRKRGTKENLVKLLRIYTSAEPTVDEGDFEGFQIRVHSTIGKDTRFGEPRPHFFRVTVSLKKTASEGERLRQEQIARAVIELQKPAHTDYELRISSNTMKIGPRSTIGKDTLIGNDAVDTK